MNCTRFFATIFLALTLSACASITRSQFAGDQTYTAFDSALKTAGPIGHVKMGDARNIRIDTTSPMLNMPTRHGRFESVTIDGRKGSQYQVTIWAPCDCLGFRKRSVAPLAFLFNDRGDLIAEGAQTSPQSRFLSGAFPEDGTYRVLVIADDSRTGEKLSSVNLDLPGAVYIPDAFSIPVKSHPTGIVQVNYQ